MSYNTFSQVPPNDLCENAIEILCDDIILGTNINSTNDSAIAPECLGIPTESGVWYKLPWVDTNQFNLLTCFNDTDFDTKISVYSGDCSNLVCVYSDDNGCGGGNNASQIVFFEPLPDFPLYILVHGSNGEEGQFALSASCYLVGMDDEVIDGFKYYPVPTQEIINLSASNIIDSVFIYNLSGQRIISYSPGVSNISVDISALKDGLYIMKVLVGEQKGIYKIIKSL